MILFLIGVYVAGMFATAYITGNRRTDSALATVLLWPVIVVIFLLVAGVWVVTSPFYWVHALGSYVRRRKENARS